MDDFDTDNTHWHRLPSAARTAGIIVSLITSMSLTTGFALFTGIFRHAGPAEQWLQGFSEMINPWLQLLLVGAILVIVGILISIARWRNTAWQLNEQGFRVRRGVVFKSETLIPRTRVQHLDIERGPIERFFGLSTLVVHTAGTRINALRQHGFRDEDAVALRNALVPSERVADDIL